uniref:Cadherin domain-containing protein n=1 Tax=Denticeps clupeoides TaxID=299321 RepID=A0AAY4BK62_9TELE
QKGILVLHPFKSTHFYCVLQVWSSSPSDLDPAILYPCRVKRDWIIPPIRVSENSKIIPENLVQIKSDKVFSGEVIYKLDGPGVNQEPKDFFEIDEKTGWIKSKKPLDRETHNSFKLKAFALSPSGQRLENPTTIEIYVLDQNDNRPVFTQPEFFASVPEFAPPGTSVMRVTATDADDIATENAALSFSIISQQSFPKNSINQTVFGIRDKTGEIYTLMGMDRKVGLWLLITHKQVVQKFRLTLQVADMSGIGLASVGYATIEITDINNHGPRFNRSTYTFNVKENTHMSEVGRVDTMDGDEPGGRNWKVEYTIAHGDPGRHFAIISDPVSNQGILSVIKPLDFENQAEHQLILTVANVAPLHNISPDAPTSSATVQVVVMNENEAPQFYKDPLKLNVPESVEPGTILATNIAHDPDNSKLRFEISYDPEKWLSINQDTGEITTRKTCLETLCTPGQRLYFMNESFIITDAPESSTSGNLEIFLLEMNDHAPQLFPLRGTMCSDHEPMGLLLSAMDEDMSPHAAPFHFGMPVDEANWTLSQINETHAVLKPLMNLNYGQFSIPVSVSDSGNPSMTFSGHVNVTVCPCNSNGECAATSAAIFGTRVGFSFLATIIIVVSVVILVLLLLLAVTMRVCSRHYMKKGVGLLVGVSDDDIRDNVLNYDEQGGGEQDENAFNINLLRNPSDNAMPPSPFMPPGSSVHRGKQPLRRDAPHNLPSPSYPRRHPTEHTDIEDFINDGLDVADHDPNVPPYDTALIYDYEGDGSLAGSLSSIASGSSDGDQDYDYLNDWGPRFKKLANMYDPR